MTSIIVDHLNPWTDKQELINIFSEYGNIFNFQCYQRYCMITYEYFQDALDAIIDMDEEMIDHVIIYVNFAN